MKNRNSRSGSGRKCDGCSQEKPFTDFRLIRITKRGHPLYDTTCEACYTELRKGITQWVRENYEDVKDIRKETGLFPGYRGDGWRRKG